MSKITILTAAAAFAVGSSASALVIDLSGETVDGAGVRTLTFQQADAGPIAGINWNLNYDTSAHAPSWGSELEMVLTGPDGQSISFSGGNQASYDVNFGWTNTSATFFSAGTTALLDGKESQGTWTLTLWDNFNDGGIDGTFLSGSFIEIKKIPAPGAAALLGLAGVAASRRRR